ncbi:MAG TPA: hypothetical protein VFT06_14730 [Flavisolibacter sp.]|nr:hypothetical protein [Flavisolibacter sp.]
MRRIFAILFTLLLLLQAIPVLHFFSSHKSVFYSYVDEEEPGQKSKVEKKELKECLSVVPDLPLAEEKAPFYLPLSEEAPSSPILEFLTPPPNAC